MKQIIDLLERKLEQRNQEINGFKELFNTLPKHRHETVKSAIRCNEEFISECAEALSLLKAENKIG